MVPRFSRSHECPSFCFLPVFFPSLLPGARRFIKRISSSSFPFSRAQSTPDCQKAISLCLILDTLLSRRTERSIPIVHSQVLQPRTKDSRASNSNLSNGTEGPRC